MKNHSNFCTFILAMAFLSVSFTSYCEQKEGSATKKSQWIDLFADGTFSSWQHPNGKKVGDGWSIEKGVVFRGAKKAGNIVTKEKYENFELEFSFKISKAGNSGVKYRTKNALGLEYQVLDDLNNKKEKNKTAGLYALYPASADKKLNPYGEWNNGKIVAKGSKLEHWLNGIKVMEADQSSDDYKERFQKSKYKKIKNFGVGAGQILLQDHGNDVWFKNVRIRKLNSVK